MFFRQQELGIFESIKRSTMCTVTLFPLPEAENGFVLTSNRDEAVLRKTLQPEIYLEEGIRMLYPRDVEAGGTWIGLSEKQRAICLLNGGFKKHIRKPPYRKSRGVVVKEFLAASNIRNCIAEYHFPGIEPFTALIVDFGQKLDFLELVWDGDQYHLRELPLESGIWSSSLLYSSEEVALRKEKFEAFKRHHPLTPENLLQFHSSGGEVGEEGLVIDRGFLKTCSITQIFKTTGTVKMWYKDLARGLITEKFL